MEVYFGEGEETSLIVYRVFYSSLPLNGTDYPQSISLGLP